MRPVPGLKRFRGARAWVAGFEAMHMIEQGRRDGLDDRAAPPADPFDSAAS